MLVHICKIAFKTRSWFFFITPPAQGEAEGSVRLILYYICCNSVRNNNENYSPGKDCSCKKNALINCTRANPGQVTNEKNIGILEINYYTLVVYNF